MTLNAYRAWLQQRERSAGTIEKYLRDTARFFRETGAPDAPAQRGRRRLAGRPGPPRLLCRQRQRHAGRRQRLPGVPRRAGSQGQTAQAPATGLLRRRAGTDPRGVFPACWPPPARAAASARCWFCRRCAPPASGSRNCPSSRRKPCAGAGRPSAARANAGRSCCPPNCASGWGAGAAGGASTRGRCSWPARGPPAGPHHGVENDEGPVRAGRGRAGEGVPPQPAAPVRQDLLRAGKKSCQAGRPAGAFQHRDDADLYHESGAEHRRLLDQMHLLL